MKLFFRIIFKIFLILTILAGCETTEKIKETDPVVLLNQGMAFYEKGQYDRAITYFNKALEINPRYAPAYTVRCDVYLVKGQLEQALSDCNKAIEINPRDAEAYSFRGHAYAEKGQYDKAIADFTKAIEINPRDAVAYNNRGFAYLFKREYEKAWDDVHKAESLGYKVHPRFIKALREASGRDE